MTRRALGKTDIYTAVEIRLSVGSLSYLTSDRLEVQKVSDWLLQCTYVEPVFKLRKS